MARRSPDLAARVLAPMSPEIRRQMLQMFKPNNCIASARMAVDVARDLGFDAYALVCEALIFNPTMVRLVREHGVPNDEITRASAQELGARMVHIGAEDAQLRPGGWRGHLVAIVDRAWLWDLSLDQANRPERGILGLVPLMLRADEAFLRGRGVLGHATVSGVRVEYLARPGDRSYRGAVDWNQPHYVPSFGGRLPRDWRTKPLSFEPTGRARALTELLPRVQR